MSDSPLPSERVVESSLFINPNSNSLNYSPLSSARRELTKELIIKRRCVVCGHLARSRCPYHSCKSCCTRANNACSLHNKASVSANKMPRLPGLKSSFSSKEPFLSRNLPPFNQLHVQSSPSIFEKEQNRNQEMMKAGVINASAVGKMDAIGHGLTSSIPSPSPPGTPFSISPETIQLRLKSLKAIVLAYQKECSLIQSWRLCKMKEKEANEMEHELECAERYGRNVSYLNEVFEIENSNAMKFLSSFQNFWLQHSSSSSSCLNMDDRKGIENIQIEVSNGKVEITHRCQNEFMNDDDNDGIKERVDLKFTSPSSETERSDKLNEEKDVFMVEGDRSRDEMKLISNRALIGGEGRDNVLKPMEEINGNGTDASLAMDGNVRKDEGDTALDSFDFDVLNLRVERNEQLSPDESLKLWRFLSREHTDMEEL